jgi:hypothetical protein
MARSDSAIRHTALRKRIVKPVIIDADRLLADFCVGVKALYTDGGNCLICGLGGFDGNGADRSACDHRVSRNEPGIFLGPPLGTPRVARRGRIKKRAERATFDAMIRAVSVPSAQSVRQRQSGPSW